MALEGPDKRLKEIMSGLDKMPDEVRKNVDKRMRRVAKVIQTSQEMLIPVNKYGGGGDLKKGQRSGVKTTKKQTEVMFWNKEHYAGYVEFGTGPLGQASPATELPEGLVLIYRTDGWVWFNEDLNQFLYSHGMPSRQFFYPPIFNNLNLLQEEWLKAVREGMVEYAKGKK